MTNVVPLVPNIGSFDECKCWVSWRRNGDKKPPRTPDGSRLAKVNDPSTWGTLSQATRIGVHSIEDEGVGIVLGAVELPGGWHLGGIDLDTCRDKKTGEPTPWAAEIINSFPIYWEVSPSGTGFKGFFLYHVSDRETLRNAFKTYGKIFKKPDNPEQAHPPGIECYIEGRYFTVTFNPLSKERHPHLSVDEILHLVREVGPAFAPKQNGETKAAFDNSRSGRPLDNSRSGRAFRLAYRIKRNGGGEDDFREALYDDGLSDWAEDERQVERAWERSGGADLLAELEGYGLNEDGIAKYFADSYGGVLRFCHSTSRWFHWNGAYWKKEETQLAFDWARKKCREVRVENKSAANTLAKAATAGAVERFARADRAFAVTAERWDADHWLLGTPEGTVDLRTGRLRPAQQADYITKITAVAPTPLHEFDPDLDCYRWLRFLDESTGGDAEAIRFLQRWCGYCLTGDTREHALLFIHGDGGNGKTVFLNTVRRVLAGYAQVAPMEMFTASKFDRHPTELAMLHGARIVVATETEAGRAWAETRIKQLTGGDPISAHFMRQDFFKYRPQFKLMFISNPKPILRNVNAATRRRFNMMPFDNVPTEKDKQLEEKLEAEWPGILAWMIQGCLDWQRDGLARPQVVIETTERYFVDQDIFGQWLEDYCIIDPNRAATTDELFKSWSNYAAQRGETEGSSNREFPSTLQARGFEPIRDKLGIKGRGYRGVALKPVDIGL